MMKNILYLLVLVPIFVFGYGHPKTNKHPKTGCHKTITNPQQYPDYYQSIESRFLVGSTDWTSDGAIGTIKVTNNYLSVNFDASWTYNQSFVTGVIASLNIYPALPNMELGQIYGNNAESGYFAKIEDNKLVIYTLTPNSSTYFNTFYLGFEIDLNCATNWYADSDQDGYGDPNQTPIFDCFKPNGYVSNNSDCDDSNATVVYRRWYFDNDNDGYGSTGYVDSCTKPGDTSYALNNTDCDDTDPSVHGTASWALDVNGDGIISDLDGTPTYVSSCIKPDANYVPVTDDRSHWIHEVSYDIDGNLTSASRAFFDDFGKSTVVLSKDMVSKKIWGTEIGYDNFGRPDKSSFIAPSNLTNFSRVSFLNPVYPTPETSTIPVNQSVDNITSSQNVQAGYTVTATGSISPGLNVTFEANSIILGNGFSVSGASGGTFTAIAKKTTSSTSSSDSPFFSYYSDNNTMEPYQATADQAYTQTNYDILNPNNVINVVGGNRINGQWKTGYSYIVPAAQELYYVFGSDFYDGNITESGEEVISKFFKTVIVDANGVENVSFSDAEGKVLATARSGGALTYPVVSLIGTQGFIDVHIPAGISSDQISLIGDISLYKIFDLKTGTYANRPLTGGNAYRIEAYNPPVTDPKVYISNGAPTYDSGALGISYSVNYYDYAVNVYNKTGQLIKSIQPNGYVANTTIVGTPDHMKTTNNNFASTFKYDGLGQLIEATSVDEGTSRFDYRDDGQISFSQSALQLQNKEVSYTKYDDLARPVASGVAKTDWQSRSDEFETVVHKEQTFTVYDYPQNYANYVEELPSNLTLENVLASAGISATNYMQQNLSGNVAVTFTKPATTITAISWYSYDIYGRIEWMVQYNEGIGAKTIHYYYDHKGNVTSVVFQKDKNAEQFIHRYTYDANSVLIKVETATYGTPFITHADYSYYQTGELKRVNIAQGLQGLDYVYTLGGQLKSINHPSLDSAKDPGLDGLIGSPNAFVKPDVFGITLDYYEGDYLRTGRNIMSSPSAGADYNGNIKAARWANKDSSMDLSGSTINPKAYLYNYDRNNWLTGATFGDANKSTAEISPLSKYKETGLTYDANGNIKSLQRTDENGAVVDNLTYNYTNAGKNQLNSVSDSAAATADITDIENQNPNNYVYDAIGQLTQNISENLYYFYNTQGLVSEVKKGSSILVKFFYNERGQRIRKESYNSSTGALQSTTFYALDLSGNTLAVYNLPTGGGIVQTDLSIFGLSRLGVYNRASATSSYEITDHLGNVRAVIQKVSGSPVMQSFADYYPFGEQLPGRNSQGNYRYAFQGQELDKETNMEAFQLRLWDGRLGRWLSPDPMGEFHSPYLGMGNTPIGAIDPNGGDIIYLNASTSVPVPGGLGYFGHAAVLIGNDHDGWRYLSMNGTGEGAAPSGGSRNADLGDIPYRNGFGNDFRGTKLTAHQVMEIVNNSNKNESHNYNRAIRIKTSTFEDGIAYQAAKKQASGANYNILGSSCIDVPQEALERVVAHRLNIQSGKDPFFWNNRVSFFDRGGYGFNMLIPNQWFNNFNFFMRNINSDLQVNKFQYNNVPKYNIIVGPITEK
ncbi:RHS repeat domain-containing protein [Flavobacterium aquiphilum]|uniref:RHS repeat domain-containing protein n=1 Tax=Flavobacterium aquiphilum TaxID=3003261 RepID=UPI002480945E|nr:RHS repeat-associated core domain-containing protein [Flavobacterium aquiphilum]